MSETDVTLLTDINLPLLSTDYVGIRRGNSLYKCQGDYLVGGGGPYVVKATNEAPDLNVVNVYPVGGVMGNPPAPGAVGAWFEALIPNAAGTFTETRRYISHDGLGWTHVGDESIGQGWGLLTLADSPAQLRWGDHRILDLAGTNAGLRLEVTVSGTPALGQVGDIQFKSLPGTTWAGGFAQMSFNDGAVVPAPITTIVDAGQSLDGVILVSNRAIGGSSFIYAAPNAYGYSLPVEP